MVVGCVRSLWRNLRRWARGGWKEMKAGRSFGYDILRCEVEIVGIGKWFLVAILDLDDLFVVRLSRSVGHDILCREVEIVDGSFVMKLSFELDILRCEVEIQVLFHQIGSELDILRCEVEIQS
ncbi:hypothetical protein F3Y22_tig00110239pilonHSYRG00176 [Hibiscus syriacus]|uniref:Uncharacterized protein n=1 Tax=Hibiscus syriacus TaxID=106335 RepID=A0A6A3B661_HIBSY|nr:hypothetical protein F3Y22_tig00110239pilonHSYRG00176 [Hibiscus syriacus]